MSLQKYNIIDYKTPFIYEIPDIITNILNDDINYSISDSPNYPLFLFGFHHLYHINKDKTSIFNNIPIQIWRVMNRFEHIIKNYPNSLLFEANKYFQLNKNEVLLSRALFKLWECICIFDLLPIKNENIICAHIAEAPGSFCQATMLYRNKTKPKNNDKYYILSIHDESTELYKKSGDQYIPTFKKFIQQYNKEIKNKKIIIHPTYSKKIAIKSSDKDTGDLTDPKTIKNFSKHFKNNIDFITADGGFPWKNENTQEQEVFALLIGQILTALKNQKFGGHFVCKFFESFTMPTCKLIYLVRSFYQKVYVFKPYTSRESNSEKYLICINFKYKESNIPKQSINHLTQLLKLLKEKSNSFVVDIYPSLELPNIYKQTIILLNLHIANRQYIVINKMIKFVNDKKNIDQSKYKDLQILATNFWLSLFFPKNLQSSSLKDFLTNIISHNNKLIEQHNNLIE